MLFNSFPFIFGFLPLALLLTYGVGRWSRRGAKLVLSLLSLGFYAWWRPIYLPLLLGSILFNYLVGAVIQRAYAAGRYGAVKRWLVFGLIVDVSLLGWFKYANFFADNLHLVFGGFDLPKIMLPLAISFYTFQKIAYLVDSAQGDAKRMSILDFALFASFFPQLISGPIVHYKEMVPQIQARLFARCIPRNMMVGLVIFAIGLFKKTVIADTFALQVNPLYTEAAKGGTLGFVAAWVAALTFILQLYFDFSGYSDMAIGLARMLGVKLPLNFHSPLRAGSIIDFWRRWHMTLQRFLTAYVFQPIALPLNRLAARRNDGARATTALGVVAPTVATFFISGFWHGAGWNFIIWGLMHAAYVTINELWRGRRNRRRRALRKLKQNVSEPGRGEILCYHVLTFLAVVVSMVMFRAHAVADAATIWKGMTGVAGWITADDAPNLGAWLWLTILPGFAIILLMPNTQQIMGRFDPAYNWRDWKDAARAPLHWTWKPNTLGIVFAGVALFLGLMFIQRGQAVFLYFNF
jgi:D-alanyl-lipoteichoic acid acyltransferase DltB (MBOAT superfamily)